jgi:2-dehydropantoate 2-reductase
MMETKRPLRIGVVGLGPVGCILTAHLIEAGQSVIPCDIDREKIAAIKSEGIRLENVIQKRVTVTEACTRVQELVNHDLDLLIVAVKTPYLEAVLQAAQVLDSERLFVLSAQNGIDNEQTVARFFGTRKTLRMVINYAGNMRGKNTVQVSFFNPPNYLAALDPAGEPLAHRLAEILNSVHLDTVVSERIQDHVWTKAIMNATLNPICAITRRTMAEVMDYPPTRELVEAIIDEAVQVAEQAGIHLGEQYKAYSMAYLEKGGRHRPSMLVDLDNQSPTEIDHLNGKIVEYGRRYGVPTPINQTITALIRRLEAHGEENE